MKEKRELTVVKAVALLIVLYIVFTTLFSLIMELIFSISPSLPGILPTVIAVILSIVMMCLAWKLSVLVTFRNKDCNGIEIKKIVWSVIIILTIMSAISMIFDLVTLKNDLEEQYSNAFLEDKDVVASFTQEELQERAAENENLEAEAKKQGYSLIVIQNILSLFINLLIFSLIPKKMLEKYDGVTEIEKNIERNE